MNNSMTFQDLSVSYLFQIKKAIVHDSGIILAADSVLSVSAENAQEEVFEAVDDMGRTYSLCSAHGWFL